MTERSDFNLIGDVSLVVMFFHLINMKSLSCLSLRVRVRLKHAWHIWHISIHYKYNRVYQKHHLALVVWIYECMQIWNYNLLGVTCFTLDTEIYMHDLWFY